MRLHARIAETLEQLYGDNAEAHAAELAHHFAEAEAVLGSGKLGRYASLAGDRALATYAYEEALGHFERALAVKEGQPTDTETAALLFGQGCAQANTLERQDVRRAAATLSRAFKYYVSTNQASQALSVAEYSLPTLPGQTETARIIPQALSLVPAGSLRAGNLLAALGEVLGVEHGDYEGACEAFNQSIAISHKESNLSLEGRTLAFAARVAGMHLRGQESLERSLQALQLAEKVDEPRAEIDSRVWATLTALMYLGDPKTAVLHAESALRTAEKLGDRYRLSIALWANETQCRLRGEWTSARSFNDQSLSTGGRDPRMWLARALLEYEAGVFDQGNAYVELLQEGMSLATPAPTWIFAAVAGVIPVIGRIGGFTDPLRPSEIAAETVLSAPTALPIFRQLARTGLALIAVREGNVPLAGEQYASLQGGHGIVAPGVIGIDRVVALLAQTMGDLDQAMDHFEDSLAFCRKAGYSPELAWTCCDYADTLLQRNEPGDRENAMSLLDESLAISSELGMRPVMERVLSRRDILKA